MQVHANILLHCIHIEFETKQTKTWSVILPLTAFSALIILKNHPCIWLQMKRDFKSQSFRFNSQHIQAIVGANKFFQKRLYHVVFGMLDVALVGSPNNYMMNLHYYMPYKSHKVNARTQPMTSRRPYHVYRDGPVKLVEIRFDENVANLLCLHR